MQLLLIPLDDSILFPGMTATVAADVGDAKRVLVLPRPDGEYGRIGTVAEVVETGRLPGGLSAATLTGLHRGLAGAASPGPGGELVIDVEELHDGNPDSERVRELEREYRAVVEEILDLRGDDGRIAAFMRSISEPGALADTTGYSPDVSLADKQRLLETVDVSQRLELAVGLQRERLAELQVRRRIRDDVEEGAQAQQREYFLRKQMESIRKELGEDDASVIDEYETKIADSAMPEAVREQAQRELARLERMGEASGEASMIRTYLDWLLAVPWGERSDERLDPVTAREVLDADHAGLEDVKDRITEYIAVRKLRRDR
ncbi:MAG TPA: LON peptidase substrate-binding domain-containing protein, partial [Solirubrobacterales bacterium]|nr:LON peptidase substrate-binding domain-containing protein [Solirubrobacterales bacterium]